MRLSTEKLKPPQILKEKVKEKTNYKVLQAAGDTTNDKDNSFSEKENISINLPFNPLKDGRNFASNCLQHKTMNCNSNYLSINPLNKNGKIEVDNRRQNQEERAEQIASLQKKFELLQKEFYKLPQEKKGHNLNSRSRMAQINKTEINENSFNINKTTSQIITRNNSIIYSTQAEYIPVNDNKSISKMNHPRLKKENSISYINKTIKQKKKGEGSSRDTIQNLNTNYSNFTRGSNKLKNTKKK